MGWRDKDAFDSLRPEFDSSVMLCVHSCCPSGDIHLSVGKTLALGLEKMDADVNIFRLKHCLFSWVNTKALSLCVFVIHVFSS